MKTANNFSLRQALTLCALLLMSFVSVAQAQVWEDTFETLLIVIKIDPAATEPCGEYCYRKHRRGIELS